ncbi:MAG: hypothetical protein V1898_01920 [Patescibacteria group bacterium]
MFFCLTIPTAVSATIDWPACRVENGVSIITASTNTVDVVLNTSITDTAQAFLLLNATGNSSIAPADEHLVMGYIKDADTLTFERISNISDGQAEVSYSLVECFNDEFRVQRGEVVIAPSTAVGTDTINTVDLSRSMVLVSVKADSVLEKEEFATVKAKLSDTETVHVSRYASSAAPITARYEVVEFSNASGVTVQTGNIDLINDVASATETISSVDLSRTWVYCSWDASNDGLQQTSIGCDLTDATTVTAYRHAATTYDNNIRFYAVEFPVESLGVQKKIVTEDPDADDDTEYTQDIPIFSISNINKAFSYTTNTTSGTNSAYPRNHWIYNFNDTDLLQAKFWRSQPLTSADENTKYIQIVEFIQDIPNTPSISGAEDADRNPDLSSSAYSGSGIHVNSDWKVVESSDCVTGKKVWQGLDDTVNKTSITVNNSNGLFLNQLEGKTLLDKDTIYYACVRYANENGDSLWSNPVSFNTNSLPVASDAVVNNGAPTQTLVPGDTKKVVASATITDSDSCQDILAVNAKFYRTSRGSAGADNDNYRYSDACTLNTGTCEGPDDLDAIYTCNFYVEYFAEPTDSISDNPDDDWTFEIIASDEIGYGTQDNDTVEIGTMSAIGITPSIGYGTLGLDSNTGDINQTMVITNFGNINTDLNISGYGVTPEDGYSMVCDRGAIPISNHKYSLSAFTYGVGGTILSSTPAKINSNINKSTGTPSTATIYLGLSTPESGLQGVCSGYLSVNAIADPVID